MFWDDRFSSLPPPRYSQLDEIFHPPPPFLAGVHPSFLTWVVCVLSKIAWQCSATGCTCTRSVSTWLRGSIAMMSLYTLPQWSTTLSLKRGCLWTQPIHPLPYRCGRVKIQYNNETIYIYTSACWTELQYVPNIGHTHVRLWKRPLFV